MKSRILLIALLIASSLPFASAQAQINMERFRRDTREKGLEGDADIDLSIMTGNTDFRLIGLNSRLNYSWSRAYTFLVLNGGIGWNAGERFMDQNTAHLRHVLEVNPRLQNEWFVQFDSNRKRNLKERELIGAGLRTKLLTTPAVKLRLGAAYMYEHERYDLTETNCHPRSLTTHRLSSYLTLEAGEGGGVSLLNVTYFQPALTDWGDSRLLSETATAIDLAANLALKISITIRYDSRPPDGVKKLDTVSKSSLSVRF